MGRNKGKHLEDILPAHKEHKNAIEQLQQQVEALQERVEDAEGLAQQNNVRIIGLPEGKEGRNPTQYVEDWLKTIAKARLSNYFTIERAHRIPSGKTQPGASPRPLIARVLNHRDRDTILQVAREAEPVIVDNTRVSLYPYYTLAVQRRRASFQAVKKRLKAEGLPYALLFLARLRVTYNQKAHFFDTPELVCDWQDTTFPHPGPREHEDALPPRQAHQPRKDKRNQRHST
ncbi:hypothetical protein NDU88_002941 [Pleurodeles waltl]|uniref:L1 transposable element RRM domain-containing protein n=1 Tax=Pleurodeles waltl TaxID=8319 RepID=A0AAV7NPK1_PLEWA|nr:hypothetical protein NDU88_002941 [Pleurodeles waltl]